MKSITNTATAALLGLVVAVSSIPTQAEALGRKERNILATIGGIAVIGAIAKEANSGERDHHRAAPPPRNHHYEDRYQPRRDHHRQSSVEAQLERKVAMLRDAFNNAPRHDRRDAQRNLQRMGFYNGGIDGAWGRGTERAMARLLLDANGNFDRIHDRGSAQRFLQDLARLN